MNKKQNDKIKNMRDLKELLNKIPDKVLNNFVVCVDVENKNLSVNLRDVKKNELEKDEIAMSIAAYRKKYIKKYKELNIINKYFEHIVTKSKFEELKNFEPC